MAASGSQADAARRADTKTTADATARARLLLFGVGRLDQNMGKGNVWYVRNYERFFDEVTVVYLSGFAGSIQQGRTRLLSLGGRREIWLLDLLLAPFRLLRAARQLRPTLYLTGDQWLSWWTALLVRRLLRARIVLMPVAIPEQLYRDGGRVVPGVPLRLERRFVRWSYRAAHLVLTAHAFGDFVRWLSSDPVAAPKLFVTDGLVEAIPSPGFFEGLKALGGERPTRGAGFAMIFVGRLHREKLVDHLIRILAVLRERAAGESISYRLVLVGDGPERDALKHLAAQLGVADAVEFRGAIPNERLPSVLASADVFVSTMTGTSLREAALAGLPIIAYDRDWLRGVLRHEESGLMIEDCNLDAFADAVRRVARDPLLRKSLGEGASRLAARLWSPESVRDSLAQLHEAAKSG